MDFRMGVKCSDNSLNCRTINMNLRLHSCSASTLTSSWPAPTSKVRNVRVLSSLVRSEIVANDAENLQKTRCDETRLLEWARGQQHIPTFRLGSIMHGPFEVRSLVRSKIHWSCQRYVKLESSVFRRGCDLRNWCQFRLRDAEWMQNRHQPSCLHLASRLIVQQHYLWHVLQG